MSDAPKFNPVELGNSMENLRSAADFERENPPGKTPTESASPQPEPPGGPDTELIFKNATGAGATDEVIDVPPEHRAALDDIARRVGGEDKVADIERRYDEANALFDCDAELDDRPLTPIERNQAALKLVADVDRILADPARAAQELDDFFARDLNDPVMKAYQNGDRNTKEMVTKLMQAAHGEPVVGLPKDRGDGFIY